MYTCSRRIKGLLCTYAYFSRTADERGVEDSIFFSRAKDAYSPAAGPTDKTADFLETFFAPENTNTRRLL